MSEPAAIDLRLAGGHVLRADGTVVAADLEIAQGRIVALADRAGPARAATAVADVSGRLLLPGLVNGHSHSASQLCRGAIADDVLEPWLPRALAAGAGFDPEAAGVAGLLNALDGLRHGVTTTLDHAALRDGFAAALLDAYDELGARTVLAVQVSDRPLADTLAPCVPESARARIAAADVRAVSTAGAALERCDEVLELAAARPLATVLLGPSAPERCSEELLAGLAQRARAAGVGVHAHVLESRLQRATGDLVGRLADAGLLEQGLSIAHACHLDEDDVERLASAGAAVIHNPLSNLTLGSGRLDVRRLLRAGVTVGLGVDGWNSGGAQDVLGQARLALANLRPERAAAEWLTPAEAWGLATQGAAAALGLRGQAGELSPGAFADVLVVDPVAAGHLDGVDPVAQLVLGGLGAGLERVYVAGELVLCDGHPVRVDAARLAARAAALLGALAVAERDARVVADELGAILAEAGASDPLAV